MPIELHNKEDFLKVVERALEIRVKAYEDKGFAKVKARTRKYLYTIKVSIDELDGFINEIKSRTPGIEVVYF